MTKKSILIILGLLILLLIGIYAYLGGFRSFEIALLERDDYQLIGHYYAGEYDGDSLETLFFEAKAHISDAKLEGTLTIVHFSPDAQQDSIRVFVGVAVPALPNSLPTSMEHRTIEAGKVLQAKITAHYAVRPLRNTVDKRMEAFAAERDLHLSPVVLEHYLSDNELHIERIVE